MNEKASNTNEGVDKHLDNAAQKRLEALKNDPSTEIVLVTRERFCPYCEKLKNNLVNSGIISSDGAALNLPIEFVQIDTPEGGKKMANLHQQFNLAFRTVPHMIVASNEGETLMHAMAESDDIAYVLRKVYFGLDK